MLKIEALLALGYEGPASEDERGVLIIQEDWNVEQWGVPPTMEEIEAKEAELIAEFKSTQYQRDRIREYPNLSVLADAIYHQANGNNEPMEAYIAACKAVKDAFPKPEQE